MISRRRWRERRHVDLIFNARDDFADLTPVSEAAADTTRSNWSALEPGQDVPLIWEGRRHDHQEPF